MISEVFSKLTNTATSSLMDLVDNFQEQAAPVAAQATDSGKDLWFTFLGIDWSTPTWDLMILIFFVISVLIYSFVLGRDRVVAILISTYIALAVTTNLPFMDDLASMINQSGTFTFQVSSFIIVFGLLFFMLSRGSIIQSLSNLSGSWWQVVIFSFLQVGLMASIILSFLPKQAVNNLSDFTQNVFVSDIGKFVWIILPILALSSFKGRTRRRRYSRFDDD